MDKISWVSGQTPINQTNLNQMQTNMEKSAVAISATKPSTEERVWIKKSRNHFSSKIISGVVSASQVADHSTRISSQDFIRVKPSTTYSISYSTSNGINQYNISYFTNAEFPRASETSWNSNDTFTTPSNCNYIMVSFRNSNNIAITPSDISNIMLNEGSSIIPYEEYITPTINADGIEIYNPIVSNWTNITSNILTEGAVQYKKSGDIVELNIKYRPAATVTANLNAYSDTTLATLPTNLRPAKEINAPVYVRLSDESMTTESYLSIMPNGNINIYNWGSTNTIKGLIGSIVYICN